MKNKWILGIWDGHDSGVALLKNGKIHFALNEERISRRKMDPAFPKHSLQYALEYLSLTPEDITEIAYSTTDFAKTLTRFAPNLKESYYKIRRRKTRPSGLLRLKKRSKYKITEFSPSFLSGKISDHVIKNELIEAGFDPKRYKLTRIKHHEAHGFSAANTAPKKFWDEGFCAISIDGIGDALSGTVSVFNSETGKTGKLLSSISGKHSFGIFFEHVTNLLGMRELEDEGKVMALANFAHPIPDEKNPILDWVQVNGLDIHFKYSSLKLYDELAKILWGLPPEQFAYLAQRTLELKIPELVKNALKASNTRNLALSGGVASNIKVNGILKNLSELDDLWVFPHMGDGGLALGAALALASRDENFTPEVMTSAYLGPEFSDESIEVILKASEYKFEKLDNISEVAAEKIKENGVVLWFQGKMEFGPRSLGHRSILARPDRQSVKDELNLKLKRRVYYQPFCPSMLTSEAQRILEDYNGSPNRYMTVGYQVKKQFQDELQAVINVDGSCRPQMLDENNPEGEDPRYLELLKQLKEKMGMGVILNTSLNLHGFPLDCSPEDALRTFSQTEVSDLFIGSFHVQKS